MEQTIGFFIFLGIFLMAFWILIFLIVFLGYWSVMGGLYTMFPKWFDKKEENVPGTSHTTTSDI